MVIHHDNPRPSCHCGPGPPNPRLLSPCLGPKTRGSMYTTPTSLSEASTWGPEKVAESEDFFVPWLKGLSRACTLQDAQCQELSIERKQPKFNCSERPGVAMGSLCDWKTARVFLHSPLQICKCYTSATPFSSILTFCRQGASQRRETKGANESHELRCVQESTAILGLPTTDAQLFPNFLFVNFNSKKICLYMYKNHQKFP